MKERTHVLSGVAVGAAVVPYLHRLPGLPYVGPYLPAASVDTTPAQLGFIAACGGLALLSDWDKRGTTAAEIWGPVSSVPAGAIGWAARGHRMGTHDAILAPLALGYATTVAAAHPRAAFAVLAVAAGLTLRGLHFAIPGHAEATKVGNLALALAAALALTWTGVDTSWLPYAVAVGILAHIAGDALTTDMVPVPVLWLFNRKARWGLPVADTQKLDPYAARACAILAAWQVGMNTEPGRVVLRLVHAATAV